MTALVLLLLTGATHAVQVKTYGVKTEANLTNLPAVTPSFSFTVCDRVNTTDCSTTRAIQWTVADTNPRDGQVDNPGGGLMNGQKWLYANQIVKLTNIVGNPVGWALQIHTENLVTTPLYRGAVPFGSSISGLVSQDGLALLPLSWQVLAAPKTISNSNPFPEQVPAGGRCGNVTMNTAGFCDFATHFMNDKGDKNVNGDPAWWQLVTNNPIFKETQKNYQSVLRPDGAATGIPYRSAYPTLGGTAPKGPYYLYIGALFSSPVRAVYQGTLRLEILTQ